MPHNAGDLSVAHGMSSQIILSCGSFSTLLPLSVGDKPLLFSVHRNNSTAHNSLDS